MTKSSRLTIENLRKITSQVIDETVRDPGYNYHGYLDDMQDREDKELQLMKIGNKPTKKIINLSTSDLDIGCPELGYIKRFDENDPDEDDMNYQRYLKKRKQKDPSFLKQYGKIRVVDGTVYLHEKTTDENMKITKTQLQKLIQEEIKKIHENKSEQDILDVLSKLFTMKLKLEDVKNIRFLPRKNGGIALLDYDGTLGNTDASAGAKTLAKYNVTLEELVSFLQTNGARQFVQKRVKRIPTFYD